MSRGTRAPRRRAKRRSAPTLRRIEANPQAVQALCAEVMAIGEGTTPTAVSIWIDREKRPRKVQADYPNGWRLTFRITADNCAASVRAQIRLTTGPFPLEGQPDAG